MGHYQCNDRAAILPLIVIYCLVVATTALVEGQTQPNIVIIMADDMVNS